jgi:hypothetical protein
VFQDVAQQQDHALLPHQLADTLTLTFFQTHQNITIHLITIHCAAVQQEIVYLDVANQVEVVPQDNLSVFILILITTLTRLNITSLEELLRLQLCRHQVLLGLLRGLLLVVL